MNKSNELLYAALCQYSKKYNKSRYGYFDDNETDNICAEYIETPLEYYKGEKDAEVLFAKGKSGELYFIFLPTNSAQDWVEDIDVIPIQIDSRVMVHKGFYEQFYSLESFIEKKIYRNSFSKIILCGFSLGGALAMIAGYLIYKDYSYQIEIHTIGAPAVGNKEFVNYFDTHKSRNIFSFTRIVMEGDPVPLMPPIYKQPSSILYIKQNGSYYNYMPFCDKIKTWKFTCKNAVKTRKLLGNHDIDLYFSLIKKNNL